MEEQTRSSMQPHMLNDLPRECPTQSTTFVHGSLTDLLSGPRGDTRFSEGNSIGYQTGAASRSALESGDYMINRDPRIQPLSNPTPPSTPLWSPFSLAKDVDPSTTYTQDMVNPTRSTYMLSQVSADPTDPVFFRANLQRLGGKESR